MNTTCTCKFFWGLNSSLVVFGLAVHSVAGSILLWGHFPVEGIFPLELTWVQTPFPQKTLSDESINRGLVCAHMHFIARTQKILTFMSRRVNAGNKNTPSTHHPRRRNVTTLMVGLTLCWAQHGRLFTSCRAGLVWPRTSREHTGSFAQLL